MSKSIMHSSLLPKLTSKKTKSKDPYNNHAASVMEDFNLLALPNDILVLLPDFLHNIEDYNNLSSTCRRLRECMDAAAPNTILRLAAKQTNVFFRPSPYFLIAATARELGHWARQSEANENVLAERMQNGIDGLFELALEHCGLTMERIRELHLMRFSIINPVTDIVDKCVGVQWGSTPNFWDGGVDDAYTISADASETLFHLAIYGELFGPDFETIFSQDNHKRRLSVNTRLEYIKYCVPDFATQCSAQDILLADGSIDPRRDVKETGPYKALEDGHIPALEHNNNIALTWLINSSRWKPHWKTVRSQVALEFQDDFDDGWWYDESSDQDWRQRMWESVMICQGLEGLGMIRPELQDAWLGKIQEWKHLIQKLGREPGTTKVGRQATLEYPYLLGDLRICASGYVAGT